MGRTSVYIAAASGNIDGMKILLGHGADPRIKTYGKNRLEDATDNFVAKALIAKSRQIYSLASMHPRSKQDEFVAKYCKFSRKRIKFRSPYLHSVIGR